MDSKFLVRATLSLVFILAVLKEAKGTEFNVKNFGAKADGKSDDSRAFTSAWKEVCGSPNPSSLLIPKGKYMVGPTMFQGPCKAPVRFQVQGNVLAPVDLNVFKSQSTWISFQNVDRLTVSGGGSFDGQGTPAMWSKNECAKNWKCTLPILTITAPAQSLNTDGIHVGRSIGINITGAAIRTGDDCVSLGDGNEQITIQKVTCGPGHGISVGSLGKYNNEQPVKGVTVRTCTFTNTMFGVRIKTWPGSPNGVASDMFFEDLVMNNVGTPVLIDQQYCPYGKCLAKVPSRVKISDVSFKSIRGTSTTKVAVKLSCSKSLPCQNVKLSNIDLKYNGKDGPATSECANVRPAVSGTLIPRACAKTNSLK
ncbi:hypothetical protein CJ030_MR6G006741 [Morella rubra]|uniref:Exopolygalacturonase n=1 Tax=Morella rubra TaxID=262757 RepID=A0A6A1VBZ3_9ROSI|nr:hypothetical protein CJ030_MR6G006741 [Morella rubra]